MIYYSHPTTGEVFAYETETDRNQFGPAELLPMTPEQVEAHLNPPTVSVITSVTMRQARLALLGAGLLDDVDAAIAAIPDETQRRAAQIEWEYANTLERNSVWVANLAAGLGLTDQQLDALFTTAATL